VPTRILATLEVLRDQVRDELLKDPRYLTYQALERSIHDIRAALGGAGPAAGLAVGPIVVGRLAARRQRGADTAGALRHIDETAKPNGNAHGPDGGDVGHQAGGLDDVGPSPVIGAVQHRSGRLGAWMDGPPHPGVPNCGGMQADSEAMANLQNALIDLINGDHGGPELRVVEHDGERSAGAADIGAAPMRHAEPHAYDGARGSPPKP
jgi:hypothetical protein